MGRFFLSKILIGLGCHHKIVLMQAFDYMRPPLDGHPAPLEHNQRVVVFFLGSHRNLVCESNCLNIVFEFKDSLQALNSIYFNQFPFRDLWKKFGDLSIGQCWVTFSAWNALPFSKGH